MTPLPLRRAHDLDPLVGAIGVVYHPERESWASYVPTVISRRFDALLHVEATRALEPLLVRKEALVEPPETFPFGE